MKYANIKAILYEPYDGSMFDYCIIVCRGVIRLLYWSLDLLIVFQRAGIAKISSSYLVRPQAHLNIISLCLSFMLFMSKYLAANKVIKNANNTEEVDRESKRKREMMFVLAKICCDIVSTVEGTIILDIMFNELGHKIVTTLASLCSALISLRNLLSK